MRRDLHEDGPDEIREHHVERAVDVRGRSGPRVDRDAVRLRVFLRRAHRERIGVDADDLTRAALGRRDREDAGAGTYIENAHALEIEVRDRLETLLRRGMQTGSERHPRIEGDGDRAFLRCVGPRRTDEEPADVDRRDRRLPRLEPILVIDRADSELADRSESERLQMAECVASIGDLRGGVGVFDEVCLDRVIGSAARRERKLDRDPVVTVAAQDLADRFDRLRVRGNTDLKPTRASCRPSRL